MSIQETRMRSSENENKAQLIVALDFDTKKEAVLLAKQIQGVAPWVKVGLELFVSEGPNIVETFKEMGFNVFLDLKLYDIPNTVKGAVSSAVKSKADLLSVHLSGGKRMCHAALEEVKSQNSTMQIFGVSVLTSFEEGELIGYDKPLSSMVEELVMGANDFGMHGIVCSGHELLFLKELLKKKSLCAQLGDKAGTCIKPLKFLTPGIRLQDANTDDQRRVMTPYQAVLLGSHFLVVGRPITKAKNPREICQHILIDIETANKELQGISYE